MKRRRVTWLFFLLLAAAALPAQDGSGPDRKVKTLNQSYTAGRQYVLLIAVDRYRHWPALTAPVADARELKAILGAGYCVDEFIELYDEAASKAAILRTFEGLQRRLTANDSLLVWFSGRGRLDELTGLGFWLPVNAGADRYEQANWLPNAQLRGLLAKLRAGHVLVISDPAFYGDLVNPSPAMPDAIDLAYFERAYGRVSRQLLSSTAAEAASGGSEFCRILKVALKQNPYTFLDALLLYKEIQLETRGPLPRYGTLRETGHQDGGSFIFFLKRDGLAPPLSPPVAAPEPFAEYFNGELDPGWRWLREDAKRWYIRKGRGDLILNIDRGDIFKDTNNCRNILLRETDLKEYVIDTYLTFQPAAMFQRAGVIAHEDDDRYVAVYYGLHPEDGGTPPLTVGIVSENDSVVRKTRLPVVAPRIYLRLARGKEAWRGYYSLDGKNYTLIGECDNFLGDKAAVGIFAMAGVDEFNKPFSKTPASFDFFRIVPTPP